MAPLVFTWFKIEHFVMLVLRTGKKIPKHIIRIYHYNNRLLTRKYNNDLQEKLT